MTASASDLTTVGNVNAWLGITSSADTEQLQRLVTACSLYIQSWLNRVLLVSGYTETRSGTGRDLLLCSNYPVKSVSSVSIDGHVIPQSAGFGYPGYYFDKTSIGLRGYLFNKGRSNVVIQYEAGYDSVPPEIEQACIETIALRYKEKAWIGHASKSLNGETVAFTITDFPRSAQTILNNYKKVLPLS